METNITISRAKSKKKDLEMTIKRMLEKYQQETGVEISGIDFQNYAIYSTGETNPVGSEIAIKLNVNI